MSDFAQSGLICTLQRLNETHLPALEAELNELAGLRPIALVLPCHGGDLDKPALQHLVNELSGARFLEEIVISVNDAAAPALEKAHALFATLPIRSTILENPSAEDGGGKGENVRAAFAFLKSKKRAAIVATQDCDVVSFRRGDLARLCYPLAQPAFGYEFAKMYYSRVTDRLYGRVSRLFLAPLLQAIVRVAGHLPLVDFLLSFRYPLAGETASLLPLAAGMPVARGWGLEIAQLCEVFRRAEPRAVCQVQGAAGYDHRHQPGAPALGFMAGEIARELFAQLAREGLPGGSAFREAIADAYAKTADDALRRSEHLARINGLPYDVAGEQDLVRAFAGKLHALVTEAAGGEGIAGGNCTPPLRVRESPSES